MISYQRNYCLFGIWTLAFTKYTYTKTEPPQSVVVMEPSTSQQILRSPIGRALTSKPEGRVQFPVQATEYFSFFFIPKDLSDPALPIVAGCLRSSMTVVEGLSCFRTFPDVPLCPTLFSLCAAWGACVLLCMQFSFKFPKSQLP